MTHLLPSHVGRLGVGADSDCSGRDGRQALRQ